jgi:hypothetical protein
MGVRFITDNNRTLHRNLKAYWTLDETGGLRRDLVGANHLTDKNSVTRARGRGISAQAGQFTSTNVEYLSVFDNAALSTGDIDFSIAAWVYLDRNTGNNMTVAAKSAANPNTEWALQLRVNAGPGSRQATFFVYNADGTAIIGEIFATSFGDLPANTWIFIVAWHDSVANTVNIQINNGAVDSVATTGVPGDTFAAFRIGSIERFGSNEMDGRLAKVGFWKKVLTAAERKALYNDGRGLYYSGTNTRFYPTHTASLTTSLTAWWELDETDRTRFDMVSLGTGPAAQFTSANSEYLSRADNASLSTGDIDFSVSAWVYLDSKVINRVIATKGGAGTLEWRMTFDSDNDRFKFSISTDGSSFSQNVNAHNFGSPATATWYFILAWHDSVANTINISVNNGTADSTATATDFPSDRAGDFNIGGAGAANNWDGRITLVGFWKKVLTSTERTRLYNSRQGRHSTQLDTTLYTSLVSYWNLNEGSGTRYDALNENSNDLTDNNTVTQASGVGGRFLNDSGSTLTTSLISYWKLDDAAGTRSDAYGVNSLTDNNTVTQATGKVGFAGQFTAANSEYLSHVDNADLSTGNIDFTIACWVYLDTNPANAMNIVTKWDSTTIGEREYQLYLTDADNFAFNVWDSAGANSNATASNFGVPSTGAWYFIVAWVDSSLGKINIQVNNGTPNIDNSTGAVNSSATFRIGSRASTPTDFWNGRIDEVGFWKRVLTAAERTDLYNSGIGTTFNPSNSVGDNNTVTKALGLTVPNLLGSAGQFSLANSEYLRAVSNAAIKTGDIDYTIACWVYLDDTATNNKGIFSKDAGGSGGREYELRQSRIGGVVDLKSFQFVPYDGTTGLGTAFSRNFGPVSSGQWYFVVGWHDSANNTSNIQINNGPVNSISTSGAAGSTDSELRIGDNQANSPLMMTGRIAEVGFWKKALSASERADLYNGGFANSLKATTFSPDSGKNLRTGLVSWWKLDEVSGTRLDFVAGNDLTDNNTVTRVNGKIGRGKAGQFTTANSEYLSRASNPELTTGDIDFTISCWVYLDSKGSSRVFAGKDAVANNREWYLRYDVNTDRLHFHTADSSGDINADSLGSPATFTWYLVVAWRDVATGTIHIQVNNGLVDSQSYGTSGMVPTTAAFEIGRQGNNSNFMDGRIDDVGFWKRILTAQERADLYNG